MKPHQQNLFFVLAAALFAPATATETQASNVVELPTRNTSGIPTTFPIGKVASREFAPVPLMRPGLERPLSGAELADLFTYFRKLRPLSP